MAVSSKSNSKYQIRSISFPAKSHTSTARIEELIDKLKASERSLSCKPSAETICNSLCGLVDLYRCMDDLLNSPLTQKSLAKHQSQKWVDEILEGLVKFLDICGTAKDIASHLKEHVRSLQSGLRRRKGDSNIANRISGYTCLRKKIVKEVKGLIVVLRHVNKVTRDSIPVYSDQHFIAVTGILVDVTETTISVLESVLFFFSVPVLKQKQSKWRLVSKLIHKGAVSCEEQGGWRVNELEGVDAALLNLSEMCDLDKVRIAQNRLQTMEVCIERIEAGLHSIFRRLVSTRASLLNIISY